MIPGQDLDPCTGVIDHLVVTCSEIEKGISDIHSLLGVTPVPGGRHPSWGSHNALLGLGPSSYLEVISADPASELPHADRPPVFTRPGRSRLNGWVAKHHDIPGAVHASEVSGRSLGIPVEGARLLPDGRQLRWTLTDPHARHFEGLAPILIDWGRSPHPAGQVPSGCRLVDFRLRHPEPDELADYLGALGVLVPVDHGPDATIVATIEGPGGIVTLT